ncbi:hypothetical protein SLE2022_196860 [Rubroshorea leprosula]
MAIEKNNFKVSRFDSEFSPGSRESMSSEEDELQRRKSGVDSDDDDDEFDDADSGAGSDDFDLLELGETGAEFCQVGNSTCSVPLELYDLRGLENILSLDVWNECLSEEERFSLTKYLPDMEQGTFMRTLKELFTGSNFHFGSPIKKLFNMLKGGLCEPRVALYREGLNFFQKHQHYHLLRRHQNNMVTNLCQIRDAWVNCRGYSIEERLRVLNIMRSQKSLMYEKMEDMESASSGREELGDGLRSKRAKDKKSLQKMGRYSAYMGDSNLEIVSHGRSMAFEPAQYGKQNPKGILKAGGSKFSPAREFVSCFSSVFPGLDANSEPYGFAGSFPRNKYDSGAALRTRDRMRLDDGDEDDDEDPMFGMGIQRERNVARGSFIEKFGSLKAGKKHELLRGEESITDSLLGSLSSKSDFQAYGRNRNANRLSEAVYAAKPTNRSSHDLVRKVKYPEVGDQMKSLKGRAMPLPLKGSRVDLLDSDEPFWHNRTPGEMFSMNSPFRADDWNIKGKKGKTGRESPDLSFKSYKASSAQMDDRFFHAELRMKPSQEKIRGNYPPNGGPIMAASKSRRMFMKNEETESDSSDQFDDDEGSNSLPRSKLAYPSIVMESSRPSLLKSGSDWKLKSVRKDTLDDVHALEVQNSKKVGSFGVRMPEVESHRPKAKQKGKKQKRSPLHNTTAILEDGPLLGLLKSQDEDNSKPYMMSKNGQVRGAYPADKRHKGEVAHARYLPRANYESNYLVEEDDSPERRNFGDDNNQNRTGKKGLYIEAYDHHEKAEAPVIKKKKGKEYVTNMDGRGEDGNLQLQQQKDEPTFLKKKGKRKLDADARISDMEAAEPHGKEMGTADVEMETKPKKKPFTLITPTVHTGFSFSIIHLLSAVRMAMISPLPDDSIEASKPKEEQSRKQECNLNGVLSQENMTSSNLDVSAQMPTLTVQEIVDRVRSNPRDPCILETQEPLQDLVRGVLKIFSSKTAPLGAKGWKALVVYEKPTKSWSWIGPVSHCSDDHETFEEVTSPEAWGIPHKMLVKLVDSFANWLKNGQETLQQIGSLPEPPVELMHINLDEKERFRDLRAQKSLNTISPSSEEVRAYFRKEEILRYSIPDRAFSYTAADGKKSIVAPLRRCGGKPTSKARDHFMLKRDRPPHVTILCLVRDAAARLPGSIGTRADVCTLIRDSQYIVEDVSDAQVNQVVSGALDRLHYERDPCVQFDGDRKLWVYLHREREEEDFEDDGTSSTKKWKRPRKDTTEQSEQGVVTVAFHGTGDQSGIDLGTDVNANPSCIDDDKKMEMDYNLRQNEEDNVDTSHGSQQGNRQQGNLMDWEPPELHPVQGNKLLCQENSNNEDFEDETFGRDRPVGLLSANS